MCRILSLIVFFGFGAGLPGCRSIPRGLEPVEAFKIDRYLGTWYEIARLDHFFERGLIDVTASYSTRPDGTIEVINRGYDAKKDKWSQVLGTADFTGEETVCSLRVTFFWPFWAGYYILALDHEGYEYAMVCGDSRDYLWILARQPEMELTQYEALVQQAGQWGFETEKLIYPVQQPK